MSRLRQMNRNPWIGQIFINGYVGDASFREDQRFSTMSRKLAVGLDIQEEFDDDGRQYQVVKPIIRLGIRGYELRFQMRIVENEAINRRLMYEVILGCDFIEDLQINLGTCQRNDEICSPICGHICCGPGSNFERKNFRSTNYDLDIDGRVILLFDMDCFEVQVHEQPHQRGKPRVVVNSSDRILAVSYEAKQLGISRSTTPYLRQAMAKFRDLIAIYVPVRHQASAQGRPRPDTSIAREATNRIVDAIKSSVPEGSIFQFSSGDEFYVDITKYVISEEDAMGYLHKMNGLWSNTFLYNGAVEGQPSPEYIRRRLVNLGRKKNRPIVDQEERLIFGSCVASTVVKEILKQTNYQSSVGIGSKKLIAKIASGLHKPGSITILAPSGLEKFSSYIKIEDIPGLGGKFGEIVRTNFQITTMNELQNVPFDELEGLVGGRKATEFLNSAFGVDDESVEPTDGFKTCSTTRKLYGHNYSAAEIKDILRDQIDETLDKLADEKRQNSRVPEKIKMSIRVNNGDNLHSTVMLGSGANLPNREQLYQRICCDCKPPFSQWSRNWQVDNLQIAAHL